MSLETELLEAVKSGDQDQVRALLDAGADVRHDRDAAVREAAFRGQVEILDDLLEKYPDDATRNDLVREVEDSWVGSLHRLRNRVNLIPARARMRSAPHIVI